MRLTSAIIIEEGRALAVAWADGRTARFHAVWLRDNATDATTRAVGNGQRLITVLDVPVDLTLAGARLDGGGDLVLRFSAGDDEFVFSAVGLDDHRYDRAAPPAAGWTAPELTLWDASLQATAPTGVYDRLLRDRRALGDWLGAVARYGFARLSGVPTTNGALCAVAELFGYVRETNYGRWFEVRAEVSPNNLAYTNLGLQAHTDNPYRDPVPTLQLLHCLENDVAGGESVVVDGFAAAERLRREAPDAFALLAGHAARFEYKGAAGVRLTSKRPMVELGPDGELLAVRFNNRSAAAFTDVPYEVMEAYYAAYRRLAEIIESPEQEVMFKLEPGELFIVDNTRVLHARRPFSSGGKRWLQGCYADKDGLLSTLAALSLEPAEAA